MQLVERSRDATLSPYLARLCEMAPWLTVIPARCEREPCPRITIQGGSTHGEIMFAGGLAGRLLEPFVIALRDLARGHADWDTPATPARMAELRTKRALRLAVSATCPHCPRVLGIVLRVALASPYVDVLVARADLGMTPDITAVPDLRIDRAPHPATTLSEYALADVLVGGE